MFKSNLTTIPYLRVGNIADNLARVIRFSPQNLLLFIFLGLLFLLHDLYYAGFGRIGDYLALLIAFPLNFILKPLLKNSYVTHELLFLSIIIFPWLFIGVIFNDAFLAVAAMAIGALVIFPITFSLFDSTFRSIIERLIYILILFSSLIMAIEIVIFYLLGFQIDITGTLGGLEARGWNRGLGYFRPSGIYQEPNAFATAMFCMLSICAFAQRRNFYIEIFGIVMIVMSKSLWGFGAAALLIYLLYGLRWIFIIGLLFSSMIPVILLFFQGYIDGFVDSSITMRRLLNLDRDASAAMRYGMLDNIPLDYTFWIGNGIDTLRFQSYAANGIAFVLFCFGAVGSFLLFFYIFFISKLNHRVVLSILFSLSTFPTTSYMFFWAYLAILISGQKSRSLSYLKTDI
jgi:hypothetical protein